jgi:hypothetical protein
MTDAFSFGHTPPPVRRRWPIALAVLLAFAAGLAVAWWGMNRLSLRAHTGEAAPVAAPRRIVVTRVVPAPVPATPPSPDLAALSARADMLASQLADVEARTTTAAHDAGIASGQAGRAEAMLLAAAARRAIDGGSRLGGLEEPLRQRFGMTHPRAVQLVIGATRTPATLESLRAGLDALGDTLVAGSGDWWRQIRRQLAMLVVVHRAGTPSPVPAERLAQARRLLAAGSVEAAAAAVAQLPGAASATGWIAEARRYVEVRRALDQLDAAAIRGEAVPAPAPAPAVPPISG